jgi:hypothetical protein
MLLFNCKISQSNHSRVYRGGAEVPTVSEQVEDFDTEKLSDFGQRFNLKFEETIGDVKVKFDESMDDGTVVSKVYRVGEQREVLPTIEFKNLMHDRIDRIHAHYQEHLEKLDRLYRARLAALPEANRAQAESDLQEEYEEKYLRLEKVFRTELYELDRIFKETARGSAGLDPTGNNEVIDTLEELNAFEKNGIEYLRNDEAFDQLTATADQLLEDEIDDIDQIAKAFESVETIVGKIEAEKTLTEDDYKEVLNDLMSGFDKELTFVSKDKAKQSLALIEAGGHLAPVQMMSPKQRIEMGRVLIENYSADQARNGLLALASMDLLTVDTVDHLFSQLPNVDLTEELVEQIHLSQDIVRAVQHAAAKGLGNNFGGSFSEHHFTASNLLIYEIIARIASAAVFIPFVLNANRPQEWPHIVSDPLWLVSAGIGLGAVDHMTSGGHIGRGSISEFLAGIGQPEAEVSAESQAVIETVIRDAGNHPETVDILLSGTPSMISEIHDYAYTQDQWEPVSYTYRASDLIQSKVESEDGQNEIDRLIAADPELSSEEAEDLVREQYRPYYEFEADGQTSVETDRVISKLYRDMSRLGFIGTGEDMFKFLEKAEEFNDPYST